MRMDEGGAAGPDPAAGVVTGAVTGAILDRLDSIGRLLAETAAGEGPGAGGRRAVPGSNLGTRIDMLGRIVEQVLAEREADEARLAALARRLVDLEAGLAPALAACAARLDAALPLLAGSALEAAPGAPALGLVLSDLRATLDRLAPPAGPPRRASRAALATRAQATEATPERAPEPPSLPAAAASDPSPPAADEAVLNALAALEAGGP